MNPPPTFWLLFADMDGTVLDKETYEPGPALAALDRCRQFGVPVVLNSSKTRAEMEFFCRRLPLLPGTPFISGNGGGVFLPRDFWKKPAGAEACEGFWKVALGVPHDRILAALRAALHRLRLDAELFSDRTAEEIAALTGLPLEQARLAMMREFDEPFSAPAIPAGGLEALRGELRAEGLQLTQGGRFHHVHGTSDKGRAVRCVVDLYRPEGGHRVRAAGVGDAANDLPLFEAVDRAYAVRRADGTYDPGIPEGKGIRRLSGIGPEGFRQAVDDLLNGFAAPQPGGRGGAERP